MHIVESFLSYIEFIGKPQIYQQMGSIEQQRWVSTILTILAAFLLAFQSGFVCLQPFLAIVHYRLNKSTYNPYFIGRAQEPSYWYFHSQKTF
jgi:hypothetical protein